MTLNINLLARDNLATNRVITLGEKKIEMPVFIPSISSFGLKLSLRKLNRIINDVSFPRVLISCYDIHNSQEKSSKDFIFIKQYVKKNILILDSGFYESYWHSDQEWSFEKYSKIITENTFDFYTSYDYVPNTNNIEISFKNIFKFIEKSYELKKDACFIPVFHSFDPDHLIKIIELYLKEHQEIGCSIAIPEKELGNDLESIISNIIQIKKIINKYNEEKIFHVLGCGDPLSILIYSFFGVDVFDSRDWAKKVYNRNNLMCYPFSYLNTLNCECEICNSYKGNYTDKVLLHNLIFYENLTNFIKDNIKKRYFKNILSNYFNNGLVNRLCDRI